MADKKMALSPLTVLMMITAMAALTTWLLPAGKYDKLSNNQNSLFILTTDSGNLNLPFTQKTLDSLHVRIRFEKFKNGSIQKPVSVPGTYHKVVQNREGLTDILQAPVKGIYEAVNIFLFILFLGAFINIFQESGALTDGLRFLSHRMKGKENWLIIILTILFSLGGASYGMAEEALVFYPVIIPVFLSAGYDLLVPVAVIFGGTQVGYLSSFTNPFATIIASNAAGVNWIDGLFGRIAIFIISTIFLTAYIVRYGNKIKKNPAASLIHLQDGGLPVYAGNVSVNDSTVPEFSPRTKLLLLLFLTTFLVMITGVIVRDWWFLEMSTLILTATILFGFLTRMKEKTFIDKFIKGAENMLGVAFIVGVARGITIVMNDGNISDTILYYAASAVSHVPPVLFILLVFSLYILLTIFISSSSAMAVLTMPILGGLAVIIGIPGKEIVNAYLYGMGIMNFLTPAGLVLPSLALASVSFKTWWRFIYPFLIFLFLLCSLFLIVGVSF
jgi:uncharacterized ion transporter superfamily protein YfcC